jgi:Rrf2 family iron-sulfur cluster assembly transcriptional regulator
MCPRYTDIIDIHKNILRDYIKFSFLTQGTETMKIGTKGHYAVAAMTELAKRRALSKPIPLNILANNQNISVNYLELLFVKLRKKGLVKSIRGAQGGYLLAMAAPDISIWDIVIAVGEGMRVNRCESSEGHYCFDQKTKCLMHVMWEELGCIIQDYLSQISLQDLLEGQTLRETPILKLLDGPPTYSDELTRPDKRNCQQSIKTHGSKKGLYLFRS